MNLNKLKEDKKYLIIIIAILLYGIFIFIVFLNLKPEKKKDLNNNYIFLNGESFYQYDNGKIKTISLYDSNFDDYLFKIYSNNKYSGEFYFSQSSSEYQYLKFIKGKTSNGYIPESPFIAITNKIDYIEFEEEQLTEEDLYNTEQFMANRGIYDIGELYDSYKINIDVDNDRENETIYIISNYDYQNIKENLFSIIYIEDGNEQRVLEEHYYTSENYMEFIRCDLIYILDFNNDGNYTLVIETTDDDTTVNNFYVKKDNYYKNIRVN